MEYKTLVLTIAPPVFLLAFWTFAGFVLRRLPPERVRGWRLFSAGGFVAIVGLAVAVYLGHIEAGATIVMIGAALGAVGLARFFLK